MSATQARVFMTMTAKSFLEMSASVRQYPAKQEMMKFMFSPYWLMSSSYQSQGSLETQEQEIKKRN